MNEDMCVVIHELYVDPDDRRKSVGSALVQLVRSWAKSEGLWPLIVECSPKNEEGKAFYEALGMRQVSIVYQED
jgi:GNAT superfamily N-acetyltransferase